MTRKKVAVIGLGNRGRFFVTALKEKKQEIELVAASDCSNERLLKTCDSYAIPAAYDDWREMLDKEELDAVVVSTPDFTHCEIVLEAFKHGNHVLVEKPMALTSTECRKMIEAADASNCFLMVGFVLRYNQFYLELKKAVDSGEIGKLVSANVIDSVSPGGRYFFHNWMRLKKHTGGLLLQKATHSVDIANWIIGGTPLEVFATGALDYFGGKESNTKRCCTCDKKTSCPDFLHKSDSHLDYENGNGYQVEKEDYCAFAKEIDIEDNEQFLAKYDNNVRLQFSGYYFTPDYKREFTFYGTGGRISAVEHYSPGEPFCKIALEKRNGESKIFSPKHLPGGHGGGDPEMINDFVHCLFSGEKPVADGLCGLNSVSLCEAAQKSITTGLIQKS